MATVTEKEISIEGIGPIAERVTLPCPPGGLVVLTGSHGVGKSTALRTIDKLATNRGELSLSDDAANGIAEGLGVVLTIGRSTRRKGEAEVVTLDGRFSIQDLCDPGYKTEEANEQARIKALVQLAGAKADLSLFRSLVGGREEFDKLVSPLAGKTDDLVTMAERVKRDLEAKAREAEGQAEHAAGHAKAAREAAGDVDTSAMCDAAFLQADLEKAIAADAQLKAEAKAALDKINAAATAADVLEDAKTSYDGLTVEDAERDLEAAKNVVDNRVCERDVIADKIRGLQSQLALAESAISAAKSAKASHEKALENAKAHEATIARWRDSLQAGAGVEPIAKEKLDAVAALVIGARQAVETGALIRKAKEQLAKAEQSEALAQSHKSRAERIREAAQNVESVLSDAVARLDCGLRVHAGRLVMQTDRSPREPLADLSEGEMAEVAVRIAIKSVGKGGLLTIPQRLFEGWGLSVRKRVHRLLVESGVTAFTAEVADGEDLNGRVFDEVE